MRLSTVLITSGEQRNFSCDSCPDQAKASRGCSRYGFAEPEAATFILTLPDGHRCSICACPLCPRRKPELDCPVCEGRGRVRHSPPCRSCGGTGTDRHFYDCPVNLVTHEMSGWLRGYIATKNGTPWRAGGMGSWPAREARAHQVIADEMARRAEAEERRAAMSSRAGGSRGGMVSGLR